MGSEYLAGVVRCSSGGPGRLTFPSQLNWCLLPSASSMSAYKVDPGKRRTVVDLLRRAADLNGDVEAYVEACRPEHSRISPAQTELSGAGAPDIRRTLTYAEWNRAADGLAGHLSKCGVGRGDIVSMILPSSIDYAVGYAASLRLGAITSGINPRLGPAERNSIFARTRPVVTLVEAEHEQGLPIDAGRIVNCAEARDAWGGTPPRMAIPIHEDDPVAVVWTSGTTGVPKGAVFDHRNLEAAYFGSGILSSCGDRRLSPLPFAHVGYMTKVWDEIAHGITTVITRSPWKADEVLGVMGTERVTVAQGVPTQWALLVGLDQIEDTDLSELRIAGTGGAPMPAPLVAEVRHRFGVPVVVRYASTETAVGTGTVPDDDDEVVAETVGRPVDGVELEIVDDQGCSVPMGDVGHVRIRSKAVMLGYWGPSPSQGLRGQNDAAKSPEGLIDLNETLRVRSKDGWVTTGDLGVIDAGGNLRLMGRNGERYIRGGYNVYPGEVENVLVTHPAVDVAAVVSAPDPVLGEVGVAFIVPVRGAAAPSLADLQVHCRNTVADYKAPDALVVLEHLPLTPMMKVDKRALEVPASEAARSRRGAEDGARDVATSTAEPVLPGKDQMK